MADTYALFAETTIQSAPAPTAGAGKRLFRLRFYKRAFIGGPIVINEAELSAPLEIEADTKDDRFIGVWPQTLTIGLVLQPGLDTRMFYVRDPFEIQIRVEEVDNAGLAQRLIWAGWLDSGDLKEPLAARPYAISLSAVCGLTLLSKQPALTLEGRYPDANATLRDVLKGCLALTGLDLPFQSILNLTPASDRQPGTLPLNRDVLESLWEQSDSFREDNKVASARDTLQRILESFSANLYQMNGAWLLVAADEPHGGWVGNVGDYRITDRQCYIRGANAAGDTISGLLDVHVNVNAYRREQLPGATHLMSQDPVISLQPTEAAVAVSQTFGLPVSRLKNGAFGNLDGAGFPVFWQKSDPSHPVFRVGDGSPATPYAIRITGSGTDYIPLTGGNLVTGNLLSGNPAISFRQSVFFNAPTTVAMTTQEYQDFLAGKGVPARFVPESAQPMRLRGRWRGQWVRGAKIWIVCRMLLPEGLRGTQIPDTAMLMDGAVSWKANPGKNDRYALEVNHVTTLPPVVGSTRSQAVTTEGYCDIDVTIPKTPFPVIEMRFEFCQGNELLIPDDPHGTRQTVPEGQTPYIDYENLTLTVGDEQKRLKGQTYTVRNYPNVAANLLEQPLESVVTLKLGDLPTAVPPTANGYLVYNQTFQPTGRFNRPRIAAGASDKPLCLWAALQRAAQVARPAQLVEGTLIGSLPYGPLSILHLLDQPGTEGSTSYYQLVGWKWNLRDDTHEVTGLEILREAIPQSVTGEWDTDNGRIPFAVDPAEASDPGSLVISEPLPPSDKKPKGTLTIAELGDAFKRGVPIIKKPIVPIDLFDTYPLTPQEVADGPAFVVTKGTKIIANLPPTGRVFIDLLNALL